MNKWYQGWDRDEGKDYSFEKSRITMPNALDIIYYLSLPIICTQKLLKATISSPSKNLSKLVAKLFTSKKTLE